MKYLLITLLLVTQLVYSQKITYFPKSETNTHGWVLVEPDSLPWNGHTQIIGHGIGERGDGSRTALEKVMNWPGMKQLREAVKVYRFRQIYMNTNSGYSLGEIDHALRMAKALPGADPNKFHYIGVSWGGYGFNNWIGKDPKNALEFATASLAASGGGGTSATIPNYVNGRLKLWAVHSTDDFVTRPRRDTITTRLVDGILAQGGMAFKSIYKTFGHSPATADWWPAMGNPYGWKPCAQGNMVAGSPLILMSMYQWQLMNPRNRQVTWPTAAWDKIIPMGPGNIVLPTANVKFRITIYDNDSVTVDKAQ